MKALVKYGNKDGSAQIMEVAHPEIGRDEVLIEVKYAGICGSDPHIYHQNISYNIQVPLILGHEFSGIIAETGKDVRKWKIGDRVTAETHADYCNECILCRMGHYHLCRDRKGYGFHVDGVFTKYVKAKQRILHKLPESLSLRDAATLEPFCVAYNGIVNNSSFVPGSSVLVIGPGAVGMLCAMLADAIGAASVTIVGADSDKHRLALAEKIGPFKTVLSDDHQALAAIKDETNEGYGFDLVVDGAGCSETLKLSMEMVRPYGDILKIGWGPKPVDFSIDPVVGKSVRLQGTFSHYWPVWEKSIELIRRQKVDIGKIITHELPLIEWEKAFALLENQQGMKVVFKI